MRAGVPYELALAFVLALAVAVLLLFVILLVQRAAVTVVAAHARRRTTVLTPLVHRALSDPATFLTLRMALRRFDHWIVRSTLLHLAVDLRGGESARIARLFRELGLLDREIAGLRSRRACRRIAAAENLGTLRIPGTFRALLPTLEDREARVRRAAVRALGDVGTQESLAALVPMLGDASPAVSREAQAVLAERGRTVAREVRGYVRQSGSRRGRLAAIELLGWHRAPEATRLLLDLAREEDPEVRVRAVKAAAAIGDPRCLATFHALLADPSPEVRGHAARGLGLLGGPDSVPRLRPLLQDRDWGVRYEAAAALAELGPPGTTALEAARSHADPRVQAMARHVLEPGGVPVLP
jgi:hypothetical protein